MSHQARVVGILKRIGAAARKRAGQNFMVDEGVLEKIGGLLPREEGLEALEIGSGLGFLTEQLESRFGRVWAVENDRKFLVYLNNRFAESPSVRVIGEDILDYAKEGLGEVSDRPAGVVCVGNIPYQISSPILDLLIAHRKRWRDVVMTVQRDFAARLAARPPGRNTGSLPIWMSLHARIDVICNLGPEVFFPRPKVESSVIRIHFFDEPLLEPEPLAAVRLAVRAAFSRRRKTISNALSGGMTGLDKPVWSGILSHCGIAENRRPETLRLEEWMALGRSFSEIKPSKIA
ncbi:MAG: ribosomal RNA small subunit methyltransferase A [Candidatus Omnitrophica bacterium]|nr:ribosomal RNA small subunit methyltransferase A [Candidatus Omnitrophota bacterium]